METGYKKKSYMLQTECKIKLMDKMDFILIIPARLKLKSQVSNSSKEYWQLYNRMIFFAWIGFTTIFLNNEYKHFNIYYCMLN